jgi:uncharacterized protein
MRQRNKKTSNIKQRLAVLSVIILVMVISALVTLPFGGVAYAIVSEESDETEPYVDENGLKKEPRVAGDETTIPDERQLPLMVDDAGLLTDEEVSDLSIRLNQLSEDVQCDVAIVTVDSLEGKTSTAFADDFYDYNGYGYGAGDDGILLVLSMEERDWAITTYGYAIKVFTDSRQDTIMDEVLSYFGDDNYYEGFDEFVGQCDSYLTDARNGNLDISGGTTDTGNSESREYGKKGMTGIEIFGYIIRGLGFGLIVGLVFVFSEKKKLKSVVYASQANGYVDRNSLKITNGYERFSYKNVSRSARQTESSSSGGGGSSTHSSSSGRSHGGSHGKF